LSKNIRQHQPGALCTAIYDGGELSPLLDLYGINGTLLNYHKYIVLRQSRVPDEPIQTVSEITVGAGKFQRLLDYLQQIGLDPAAMRSS